MLKDLFEAICDKATDAREPKVVELPGGEKYLVESRDGVSTNSIPRRRSHAVSSLDDLLRSIDRWCESGTVWHSELCVQVAIDDSERLDRITLALSLSDQFLTLTHLPAEGLDHRSFIRLLRHDLEKCGAETLLSIVRKVEFKRQSDGRSDIRHGGESLGKSVESAVNATSDVPEMIVLSVPVYDTPGIEQREQVGCSIDIDVHNERFILTPFPGELTGAMHRVQAWIGQEVRQHAGDGVSVFGGKLESA